MNNQIKIKSNSKMNHTIFIFLTGILINLWQPSNLKAQDTEKIEIMLVGFAHLNQLSNGTPESNIFSKKKQAEIVKLTNSLKKFKPDMVMVELEPKEQKWNDSLFDLYKSNELDLRNFEYGAGETFQVGFRLGKMLELKKIYGVNYYSSTSQSLLSEGENIEIFHSALKELQNTARPLNKKVQQDSLSIYDFIRIINRPEMIDLTHHLLFNLPAYVRNGNFAQDKLDDIDMNNIDKEHIGAEFISLFYNRNLKIYSNILNTQMKTGKKKLLLIIGQAHVGILTDLFEDNKNYSIVSVLDFLENSQKIH